MLTEAQKELFHEKGYLLLPQIIAKESRGFEDFVWNCLSELHGIKKNDPSTWNKPGAWIGMKAYKEAKILKRIGTDRVCNAIDSLLGKATWKKPNHWGGFLINFPDTPSDEWYLPNAGWHVDYHFTNSPDTLFGIRVFVFLSKVSARCGGTLLVSGSHQLVAQFVRSLTEEEKKLQYAQLVKRFNTSNNWLRALTQDKVDSPGRIQKFMDQPQTVKNVELCVDQLCGRPGDVVLMHPWTLHTRSPHAGKHPRFMLAKSIYCQKEAIQVH